MMQIDPDDKSKGWKIIKSSLSLNAAKSVAYNTRKRLFRFFLEARGLVEVGGDAVAALLDDAADLGQGEP